MYELQIKLIQVIELIIALNLREKAMINGREGTVYLEKYAP
jgi:hypothetical protein